MAHNINRNELTGAYSFMSVRERAWHNLGTIVNDYPTSEEAIIHAGLDFEVEKAPNDHRLPSGRIVVSDNSFFTYRTDTEQVLGDKLGTDYNVLQNRDAFRFFDSILKESRDVKYETAGALGKGEKIFITAKLPGLIRVGNNDVTEKFIFLYTSHDGSGSTTAAFTPIRIVCNNTLNAAMRNMTNVIRIRHTAGAPERLEEAHRVMGISNQLAIEMEEIFNHWAKVRITDKEVLKLVQAAMASRETIEYLKKGQQEKVSSLFRNTCEKVLEYGAMHGSQQLETTKGTLFGAYNMVTGYYQNVRKYDDQEAKMKSTLFGGDAQRKSQKAFDLCTGFARIGADAFRFN